jgi:hypothetical protein
MVDSTHVRTVAVLNSDWLPILITERDHALDDGFHRHHAAKFLENPNRKVPLLAQRSQTTRHLPLRWYCGSLQEIKESDRLVKQTSGG